MSSLLFMQKTLDKITIKLCEKLPWDFTFYEEDGFCEKPSDYCEYCKKITDEAYICNKKTYTPFKETIFVGY